MNKLIAIIDDEPDILELVALHLKKSGFKTAEFENAGDFLKFLKKNKPALIVLDLMLPDMDGLEVCKHLKKDDDISSIPIIMLTAKGEETDKVLGLELGADDYVTKPFSPKELTARVKAVLRRKKLKQDSEIIEIGGILEIDPEKYEARVEGKKIELTTTEFRILHLLASKKERVFSREQILDYLWGEEKAILDRTIDVHIRNLRHRLKKAAKFIKNVRGIGYKLEE